MNGFFVNILPDKRTSKFAVRLPASPEEEEDSSFERKDHLAKVAKQPQKKDTNGPENQLTKKQTPATPKKHASAGGFAKRKHINSFLGSKVVCHVRGKRENLKGIVKWRGYLPTLPRTKENIIAGIELAMPDKLGTDGTFMGKRYFQAPGKRGYFVKYKDCKSAN